MSRYLKIFSFLVVLAIFSEGVFDLDRYQEQSAAAENSEHCCVQCCPTHHLMPAQKVFASVRPPAQPMGLIPSADFPALNEIVRSIFHPPKFA